MLNKQDLYEIILRPVSVPEYDEATQVILKFGVQQFNINDWCENKEQAKFMAKCLHDAIDNILAKLTTPQDESVSVEPVALDKEEQLIMKNALRDSISPTATPQEAISPAIAEVWQPIETAPKDGSRFDVWLGGDDLTESDRQFYCTANTKRSPDWIYSNGKFRPYTCLGSLPCFVKPTHWMPLPSKPTGLD
jgi:hypothetical protein